MSSLALFATTWAACLLCAYTASGLSFHAITGALLSMGLLSWLTSLPRGAWRVMVQWAVGWLVMISCLVDAFCQETFGCPITPQIVSNMRLTNVHEANDFFTTFIDIHVLEHGRILAIVILAIALPPLLIVGRNKQLRPGKRLRLAALALLAACIIYEAPAAYHFSQMFTQHGDTQAMEGLIFRRYHEQAPTPLHRYAFARYSLSCAVSQLQKIKESSIKSDIDSCSHLSPHIVLIIGESYNKHHSTLYGYHLPTTPAQQKRCDEGELMPFTDVVTPWNITSNVFLSIFSLWEHGMEAPLEEQPLFPILFRRAGYDVNFFSNQYVNHGLRRGSTNQAGHFFLANKELSKALFTFRNRRTVRYDMPLLRQLHRNRKKHSNRPYTLDIIHLVGQHFAYAKRYPEEAAFFTKAAYAQRNLNDNGREIVMHYDNATRYDDAVLDSILQTYSNEEAIVLFVADHGEEVMDDLPVHGRLFQEPTAATARQEYEVPLWMWCSPAYREKHPEVLQSIRQAQHKPFMTDGLPQILLHLAGIASPWTHESRDLLSPAYVSKPRIIAGCFDYNQLVP